MTNLFRLLSLLAILSLAPRVCGAEPPPLRILFLGDNGHHRPADRFAEFQPRMARRGIELTYTERRSDLNRQTLAPYDGLIVFANHDSIEPDQAQALLEFVEHGGGFIPLHCASYCFRNSPEYVALVGGQFQRHGGEVFGTEIALPEHPVMAGFGGFRSWDETYIHTLENEDREILEYRRQGDQAPGREREPYTWVRSFGQGRVFYTAWGHDQRTWGNPGFINLVERGIRWACGGDPAVAGEYQERPPFVMPAMTPLAGDLPPFQYDDVGAEIPNYVAGESWGAQGKPLNMMQRPLAPDESLRHFVTPTDFSAELYASEEGMGAKPIAMAWDDRGRLWVCLTIDYPNEMRAPDQGNDRIMICEDTDADQVADRFTLFAERLSIPTAIVHYRGGVIVQDGTRTLFLKDTNGDDVADLREVLITGWEMGDTHGGVSNFRYGPDNWIWGMQGYNNSQPTYAGGRAGPFRMGFFRFRLDQGNPPRVLELEFIRSTDNNTWGLGISEEGLIFGSTANRNPSTFMPIPNRYSERVRAWGPEQVRIISDTHLFKPITDKIRQVDHHGGYTAAAGHALYTARHYPSQWWNRTALVNGPTGHLVGIFVLQRDGAGYKSFSPGNLLASDDEWSAPILSEVGPDGNVWVIDWYNYIVQHNPTPQGFQTGRGNAYESKLRDKIHGRIVRVAYSGREPVPFPRLSVDEPLTLVEGLRHPNFTWRLHAQRLLVERGMNDVVPSLLSLVEEPTVDEIGLAPAAMHALWTLSGLGVVESTTDRVGQTIVKALAHRSAGVRRAALQVLPSTPAALKSVLESGVLKDDDPQVRLAAILAIADIPAGDGEEGERIAALAGDMSVVTDRWLADALTSAAAVHSDRFLGSFLARSGNLSEESTRIAQRIALHSARGRLSPLQLGRLLASLRSATPERNRPILSGLTEGWPAGYQVQLDGASEEALRALAEKLPGDQVGQLVALASRMGTSVLESYADQLAEKLLALLADANAEDPRRLEAATQLIALLPTSDQAAEGILESIDLQMDPGTATALLQVVQQSRGDGVGVGVLRGLSRWTPGVRLAAIGVLLSRPAWTESLIAAIQRGEIGLSDLALDQRQALASHPQASIRDAAVELMKSGGGLPSADRVAVIEQYHAATTGRGNSDLGRELYKEHCGKCHRHGELGQEIGPELTGMAVHPKEELLVHILDPSRSVEGNFRSYSVLTTEGRVLTGMLAGESRTTVELIDTMGKRETIPRADIEQLTPSTKSVMPEGFEAQLSVEKMTDLLEFLTTRGKYLPLDLRQAATLPTDRPMFYGGEGEVLMLDDWGPKVVAGVPFTLLKPSNGRTANAIMLYGPEGRIPPRLPREVEIPVGTATSAIHLLSGVGGWNAKGVNPDGPPVMTVRLIYADGSSEDHVLRDGVHFADYIGPFEVPESEKAFLFQRGYQMRYLKLRPQRPADKIAKMVLIKNRHPSSPIVMAVTLEE